MEPVKTGTPTLLDTHAWIWWVTDDRRLSAKARSLIKSASELGTLQLSMISIWELAKKVEKKQLVLDRDLDLWITMATEARRLHLIELTSAILLESCRLPGDFHGDPADQIIVATTRKQAGVLITRDR